MRTLLTLIAAILLTNLVEPATAQTHDVVGQWQGHMYPGGPRIMLVIRKDAGGDYVGEYYLPDTSPHAKVMAEPDFKDGVFTFLDGPRRYRGKLSADGAHIDGVPFNFDRAGSRQPGADSCEQSHRHGMVRDWRTSSTP